MTLGGIWIFAALISLILARIPNASHERKADNDASERERNEEAYESFHYFKHDGLS